MTLQHYVALMFISMRMLLSIMHCGRPPIQHSINTGPSADKPAQQPCTHQASTMFRQAFCLLPVVVCQDISAVCIHNMQGLLSTPLALTKLGIFMMEARHHQTTKPRKNVVLVGPASAARQCLVVGVMVQPTLGSQQVHVSTGPES